jgi:hypothetical protein
LVFFWLVNDFMILFLLSWKPYELQFYYCH